jgi:predicted patatin/cPLA2 family phospholipase
VPGSHTSDTKLKAKLTKVATGRRSGAFDDAESDILEVAPASSSMPAYPILYPTLPTSWLSEGG